MYVTIKELEGKGLTLKIENMGDAINIQATFTSETKLQKYIF